MRTRYLMKVLPYDSLTRRLVTSQHDPDTTYLVDLLEYGKNGKCSCLGFAIKHQPVLEAMPLGFRDLETGLLQCKHIKLVRAALGIELLESLLEIEHAKETKTEEGFVGWSEKADPTTFTERVAACKAQANPQAQQSDGETDAGIQVSESVVLGATPELHGMCASPETEQCGS